MIRNGRHDRGDYSKENGTGGDPTLTATIVNLAYGLKNGLHPRFKQPNSFRSLHKALDKQFSKNRTLVVWAFRRRNSAEAPQQRGDLARVFCSCLQVADSSMADGDKDRFHFRPIMFDYPVNNRS
jgi:hypothetical protein